MERTQINADMVVEGLLIEAEGKGVNTSPGARVTAWTQLGKHLGMFKDNVNLNHGPVDTLAELMKEIDGKAHSYSDRSDLIESK